MMLTRGEPLVSFKSFVIPYPDVVAGRGEDCHPDLLRFVGKYAYGLIEFGEDFLQPG